MSKIILGFNAILIVVYALANLMFNVWKTDLVQEKFVGEFQTQELLNGIQVANTGTSHGSVSFDWKNNDRIHGINFGRSGQPPYWDLFLLDYYKDFLTDALIIIPISFHTFCMNEQYDPIESIYTSRLPFFGIGASQYSFDLIRREHNDKDFPSDSFNFERFSENTIKPSQCEKETIDNNLSYFSEIINSFDNVVLITTPYYIPSLDHLNEFDWFYKKIETLSKEYSVKYYDYSRDIRFNDFTFFYNSTHLNTIGREKFTDIIIDEIVLNYIDFD